MSFDLNSHRYRSLDKLYEQRIIRAEFKAFIKLYTGHPATLMWLIGNEPNRWEDMPTFFEIVAQLIAVRDTVEKETGTVHPLCVPLADTKDLSAIIKEYGAKPHGELWCLQAYRGETFKRDGLSLFTQLQTAQRSVHPKVNQRAELEIWRCNFVSWKIWRCNFVSWKTWRCTLLCCIMYYNRLTAVQRQLQM